MKKTWLLAGASVLALGFGCAMEGRERRADREMRPEERAEAPRAEQVEEVREELQEIAQGSQPGRIVEIEEDRMLMDPFEEEAGIAHFHLPPQVPIFGTDRFISRDELEPGTPVNVYFDIREDQDRPVIVGIEVLTPNEARRLDEEM